MGRLFDSPLPIIILIVLALLLFGAPKLPGMARSMGQSLRIFKSEVKQMKDDPDQGDDRDSEPVEGRVIDPSRGRQRSGHRSSEASGSKEPPADRSS